MANPRTRSELKEYCLRDLGKPVININVDDTQVEDRIDEALQNFRERHYDASEKDWIYYELTELDITNGYIIMPDNIMDVVDILPLETGFFGNGEFSFQNQFAINELSVWKSFSTVDYFMSSFNYQNIVNMTTTDLTYVFSIHQRKLKIHKSLAEIGAGTKLAMRVFLIIDPDEVAELYGDKWLKKYATALIKRQWGTNMKKFSGIQMLGGSVMNGKEIYDEAEIEIEKLELQLREEYSEPVPFFMG